MDSLLEFVDTFRDRTYRDEAEETGPFPGPEADHSLGLEGIFLTMASSQTRMGRHVAARVEKDFGNAMFDSAVPRTTRLSEMALRGKPAVIYDRRSPGSRAYFDLADELIERFSLAKVSMGMGQDSSIPDRFDPLDPADDSADGTSGELSTLKMPPVRWTRPVPDRSGWIRSGDRIVSLLPRARRSGNRFPGRTAGRGGTPGREIPGRRGMGRGILESRPG